MIDLNIQTIAKWFEKGCCTTSTANTSGATNMMMTNGDTSNGTYVNDMESSQSNTNEGNDQFYILQCNDICLLSKLTGVKNQTLFDRARKQMDQIMEPVAKKNFLLTICSELLRDGRRSVLLKMIDYEVEHNTELFKLFPTDLLFHRALCLLKHGQPTKALADLYMAFEHGHPINGLDRIHVQILEEIKKYLSNRKTVKDGFITNANNEQITFEQILIHYENEIVYFVRNKIDKEGHNANKMTTNKLILTDNWLQGDQAIEKWDMLHHQPQPLPSSETVMTTTTTTMTTMMPTYKSKLIGTSRLTSTYESKANFEFNMYDNMQSPPNERPINQFELTYLLDESQLIRINPAIDNDGDRQQQTLIDNIFNLRAILIDNLCPDAKLTTISELFRTFGTIINIRSKDSHQLINSKLIIEYDNSDSPRMAISCLSNVTLPGISKQSESLHFRFYKSENQKHLRICKQNQIKTSRECYFWRTTGCQNYNCKYFHNKLAKGVDYQEWMKIEQSGTANVDYVGEIAVPIMTDKDNSIRVGTNHQRGH